MRKERNKKGGFKKEKERKKLTLKDITSNTFTLSPSKQLMELKMRTLLRVNKVPHHSEDSRTSNVNTSNQVSQKSVTRDNRFVLGARVLFHNTVFGRVETEGNSGEPISHKVHPQQLDREENLGKSPHGGDKDSNDFPNVGTDKVTDKLLGVIVDAAALLNGRDNGREVIISEDHLGRALGHRGTGTHSQPNVSRLQSGGIVHTVSGHGNDFVLSFQAPHQLLLVDGLDTGEKTGLLDGIELLLVGHELELVTGEGLALDIFILSKDTDLTADSGSSIDIVTSDNDNINSSLVALLDSVGDLSTGRVQDTNNTNEGHVRLELSEIRGFSAGDGLVVRDVVADSEGQAPVSMGSSAVGLKEKKMRIRKRKEGREKEGKG